MDSAAVKRSVRTHWKQVVLVITILIQSYFLLNTYAYKWGRLAVALREYSSFQRSGILFSSKRFSDFMGLVRDVVPENGTVVYLGGFMGGPTGHKGVMQYYLFPRNLVSCRHAQDLEDCILHTFPKAYVLAVGEVPSHETVSRHRRLIPFEPDRFYRGIYTPVQGVKP
jgi:hypothetical protein